jgi:aldose sugar dehydrogenase
MAFDPMSGGLWLQENGDDTFSELNLVERGMNGGWIQICGPVRRIAQFKEIETTFGGQNLQQLRWPPTNIADSASEALARLFLLPGARYSDPEFS